MQNGVGAWSASGKIQWSVERRIFFLAWSVERSMDQNWLERGAVRGITAKCGALKEKENRFIRICYISFL